MSPTTPKGASAPSSSSDVGNYRSLKQSFAASLGHGEPEPRHPSLPQDGYFASAKVVDNLPKSSRAEPPIFVEIPKIPSGAETALLALQYLPTPTIVLSTLKTVLLANDAMGLLLGLDNYNTDNSLDGEENEVSIGDLLRGQSLSQIGIDLIQEGQPIWVSWEV